MQTNANFCWTFRYEQESIKNLAYLVSHFFSHFSESKRFLGDFKLNPYKFSCEFKDPDDPTDPGFGVKSVELEISNGPVDGFKVDIDQNFKTNYLKFQRSLHSLAYSSCPNISHADFLDNSFFNVFDLSTSGGMLFL